MRWQLFVKQLRRTVHVSLYPIHLITMHELISETFIFSSNIITKIWYWLLAGHHGAKGYRGGKFDIVHPIDNFLKCTFLLDISNQNLQIAVRYWNAWFTGTRRIDWTTWSKRVCSASILRTSYHFQNDQSNEQYDLWFNQFSYIFLSWNNIECRAVQVNK